MSKEITGALFKQMILHGAAAITAQKQAINDLNVFPVPDGDTGTNMSMTIATAAEALRKAAPASVGQASSVTASALLQGARGNSGVILSLLFRGLSKALKGMETADAAAFAAAMQEGVAAAYKAVMKPAEGTVLTVSRLAAKRAVDTAAEGADVEATLAAAIEEGYDALAQTTDMNPVLKKAGVVDAGGKGYLLILEGMLAELRGEPIPENEEEPETHKEKADFNAMAQEEITFTFDTVYVVRKAREDIDLMPLRAYLSSIGDSLVIGEDDETFKVHVHTDIPGAALTESQKYGTLELAKIENMRSQADALAAGQTAQSTDDLDAIEEELENGESGHKVAAPEKAVGFLAICAGDGLAAVFRDLGCDAVVSIRLKATGDLVYGSNYKLEVQTNPADTQYIGVVVGVGGEANGYVTLVLSDKIRTLLKMIPLPKKMSKTPDQAEEFNVYSYLKQLIDGNDVSVLLRVADEAVSVMDVLHFYVPTIDQVSNGLRLALNLIRKYLPEGAFSRIYLDEQPVDAGNYVAGALALESSDMNTAGFAMFKIKPKTNGVRMYWAQQAEKPMTAVELQSFNEAAVLEVDGQVVPTDKIRYSYKKSGWGCDATSELPTEPGTYVQTAEIGGNYSCSKISRNITVK